MAADDRISFQTSNHVNVLTAETDGILHADRTAVGEYELWTVVHEDANGTPLPPDECGLRSFTTNAYLSAFDEATCTVRGVPPNSALAVAPYVDLWERWRFVRHLGGIALQSVFTAKFLSPQQGGGGAVLCDGPEPGPWEELIPSSMEPFGELAPIFPAGGGAMRPIDGQVRVLGRSFGDAGGPRILHGCSDFGALIKFHEDRDKYLRQLDVVAGYQQYSRIAWRLNGGLWTSSGLTVDPIRDSWWEAALRGVLQAHRDRGLKVNLSSFDMNNWSDSQAEEWFTRTAQIAREFGEDLVWLSAVTNEMQGTWSPGECDENVAKAENLMGLWTAIYPWGVQALSDPMDRDRAGMQKLAWTCALIHDIRWTIDDALRHCFNSPYENWPDCPIVQDEPTGPNGSPPHNEFTRQVYQPIDDPDELFALYTMHVLTGQASTYFNDPALYSREPLDSTWGFKELPQLWRDLEMPEDIGQGTLGAGHVAGSMMQVVDSHASRADGTTRGAYSLGVISGQWDGQPWAVRAGHDGTWSVWYANGKAWEGHLSTGQVIPTPRGFVPAVVRCLQ